ncbi:hypothetical protein CPIN18021_1641 [Campylobacter pinnipediorum subsp. caledonicus]|uniref:Uncharacterized protein n=1 Tax=Campylobacter pinnipediorum subsp. caledonicus TaxID=1874362 RepID=A0A1S6U9P6_9BACT|nr:SPOR domain-containing protein [Campylobacter pinnipediorum]AQW86765.1 hypothetical protein CPIN18020_1587 [Campylobacter pinnipediorum subsp. caledonicus]AQW88420.1 hypothetical protein CPIN18021_1641 [Campylobacter pinnipediorum subsp. caledonicus]OPA72613.1 hypothetical protein BB381_05295 [Campylobacter pinnipediorum subsp. caledonicus]
MQNSDELKDILLDNEDDTKNLKLKKVLILVAALSILFLIVIATMKIINSNDNNVSSDNELDSRLALPPIPDEKPEQNLISSVNNSGNNEQLFEQVPILPENKSQDDFEDMVKRLKEKENVKQEVAPKEATKEQETNKVIKEVQEQLPETVKQPEKEIAKKEVKDKKTNKQSTAKKPVVEKVIKETRASLNKETKDVKKAQNNVSKESKITAGAYIQVSATSKVEPDKKELNNILIKGYEYKTLRVGSTTKVLIGPFDSSKLKTELEKIRKTINKGAFVYRVK